MNQRRITVFIADAFPHVRDSLSALLSTDPEFVIVGLADNAPLAVREGVRNRPDLILIDPKFGQEEGWGTIFHLKKGLPQAVIVIHSSDITSEQMLQAIQSGASDIIPKSLPPGQLIKRLKMADAHQFRVHPALASGLLKLVGNPAGLPTTSRPLTQGEWQVLTLAVREQSVAVIAGQLGQTPGDVFTTIASLIDKVQYAFETHSALVVAAYAT